MSGPRHQPFKDYFSILGIQPEDGDDAIRAAYREKAFLLHPDRNQDPRAHEEFLALGEAYHVLSNPEQRRRYLQRYWHVMQPTDDLTRMKQALAQRQELTRMKRAERYRGSRYTQRVKYRGATQACSSPGGSRPQAPGGDFTASQPRRHAPAFSDDSMIGYTLFGGVMKWTALALLLLCIGMGVDFANSRSLLSEKVAGRKKTPKVFVSANGITIRTNRHHFFVHGEDAKKMPVGRTVTLFKSPVGGYLTHVEVEESGFRWKFRILNGPYGAHLWTICLVGVVSFITLLIRKSPKGSAYIGTVNVLLALSVLGLLFSS